MSTVTSRLDLASLRPSRRTLLVLGTLVNVQVALLLVYLHVANVTVYAPRYLLYPLVWITASVLAVYTTEVPSATRRARHVGLVLGGGYFLLLAAAGGLLAPAPGGPLAALLGDGHFHSHGAGGTAVTIRWLLPPGMGPLVIYQGALVKLTLLPYEVIGYATLAFLVYVGVVEAAGSTVSGVLGLFSCVSCAWPVLGGVVTTAFGGGSALAVAATNWPYDLSLVVFLSALALLYWRPSW